MKDGKKLHAILEYIIVLDSKEGDQIYDWKFTELIPAIDYWYRRKKPDIYEVQHLCEILARDNILKVDIDNTPSEEKALY